MIGQKDIIEILNSMIYKNEFPKFLVLVGPRGCGKQTLAKLIAKTMKANFYNCGIKVDEVREIIDTAMSVNEKTVYCIPDADNMRSEAKNALLKITEEPPRNAYFILTVRNTFSLLDTIKSRSYLLSMQNYTIEELQQYAVEHKLCEPDNWRIYYSRNMNDLKILATYGDDFKEYVDLVFNNIAKVVPENAFKSANKLNIKKDEGYDLEIFFNAFFYKAESEAIRCMITDVDKLMSYCMAMECTSYAMRKLDTLGSNKQRVYDEWVFSIREALNFETD